LFFQIPKKYDGAHPWKTIYFWVEKSGKLDFLRFIYNILSSILIFHPSNTYFNLTKHQILFWRNTSKCLYDITINIFFQDTKKIRRRALLKNCLFLSRKNWKFGLFSFYLQKYYYLFWYFILQTHILTPQNIKLFDFARHPFILFIFDKTMFSNFKISKMAARQTLNVDFAIQNSAVTGCCGFKLNNPIPQILRCQKSTILSRKIDIAFFWFFQIWQGQKKIKNNNKSPAYFI
jgi:hypothetical protein